jgi:hypothetical protein
MPDATITSTASTFGTISGTFAADQSTITGTITGVVSGTLSGSVGVPGPQGPAGPGSTWGGIAGVLSNQLDLQGALDLKYNASNPAGYQTAAQVSTALAPYLTSATASATYQTLAGMSSYLTTSAAAAGYYPLSGNPSGFLTAASLSGYATESWVTGQGYITSAALSPYLLSSTAATTYYPLTGNPSGFLTSSALTPYLTKADNLASVASTSAARDNLGLGSLSTPTFAGVTAQGSGANVANLTPTSLSLNHATSGSFVIQPSVGITFPDASVQTTAFTTSQLTAYLAKASNLSDLASTSAARSNLGLGSLAVVNDAPSDGSQYARKNGAWDVVTATSSYITSVSSPLSVTSGNLTIDLSAYAPLASPVFTGDARAVTPALGDNDTSIATTAFVQSALLGGTAVARNLEVEVRNQSGSTVPAGSIVYISGATGNKPLITLAQANNDANSAQTIGFVKTSIANNGTGFVIVRGELENIDTSALTEGVQLYLSPTTAGTWTTTKPSAPQHLVYVGIVIRSHPTLGTILVAVQNGYELGEIHDVALSGLANNDLLAYESSTDLWKNKTYSALGLLTSAYAASTYAPKASPTFTGLATFDNSTNYALTLPSGTAGYYSSASSGVYSIFNASTEVIRLSSSGIKYPDGNTQSVAFPGFTGYAPLASPSFTGNVTITSNSSGAALFIEQSGTGNILTLHDQASDTNFVAIDQNGKVNTIPSVTASAGFNVPHGTAPTSPVNGDIWTTTGGLFMRQNGTTQQYVDLAGTQTINGTKTFSGANQTLGNATSAGTINVGTGATVSGATRTIQIGINAAAGSTNAITIGSTAGTSTTTLQGTTNGVTAAVDTNSVALATTAYVVGQAGSATPLVNGTAAVGTSLRYARQDHVHPTDTSRAALASPTFTGTPLSTTAAVDTNTTQIATTAFVLAQAAAATPLVDGTAAVGTSTRYARADHVHPTDTTRAPLNSPSFSGTPSLPTGTTAVTQTAGNNTTAVATTAFVTAAVPAAATVAEAKAGTDTAKFISANVLQKIVNSPSYYKFPRGSMSTATFGTGAAVTAGALITNLAGTTTGAGGAQHEYYGLSGVDIVGFTGWEVGSASFSVNFGKQFRLTGSTLLDSKSNTITRVTLGKNANDGVGDPAQRAIGWRYNHTTGFIEIIAHNGTSLVTQTTAFNPNSVLQWFEWELYNNGTGSVQMFVNDVSIGTLTGGPTISIFGTAPTYQEEIQNTATPSAQPVARFRNGGLFLQP